MTLYAYRVIWEIDVEASDPVDAARKARDAQRRLGTTATIFQVVRLGEDELAYELTDVELEPFGRGERPGETVADRLVRTGALSSVNPPLGMTDAEYGRYVEDEFLAGEPH